MTKYELYINDYYLFTNSVFLFWKRKVLIKQVSIGECVLTFHKDEGVIVGYP